MDSIEKIHINPEDHFLYEWISEDNLEKIYTENKRGDDPEIRALRKGSALLRGENPNF